MYRRLRSRTWRAFAAGKAAGFEIDCKLFGGIFAENTRSLQKCIELESILQAEQLLNLPTRHGARSIALHGERFQHPPRNIAGTLANLVREIVRQLDRHLQSVSLPFSTIFRRLNSVVHANVALGAAFT